MDGTRTKQQNKAYVEHFAFRPGNVDLKVGFIVRGEVISWLFLACCSAKAPGQLESLHGSNELLCRVRERQGKKGKEGVRERV